MGCEHCQPSPTQGSARPGVQLAPMQTMAFLTARWDEPRMMWFPLNTQLCVPSHAEPFGSRRAGQRCALVALSIEGCYHNSLLMAAALSKAQELAIRKAVPAGTVALPEALGSFEILQQWKIPSSLPPKRKEMKRKIKLVLGKLKHFCSTSDFP